MTQKQILSVILGVLFLGIVFVFIYHQFRSQNTEQGQRMEVQNTMTKKSSEKSSPTVENKNESKNPESLPESIDGISVDIEGQASTEDSAAMNAEEEGETSQVESDNQSVNALGTSYDENNL